MTASYETTVGSYSVTASRVIIELHTVLSKMVLRVGYVLSHPTEGKSA